MAVEACKVQRKRNLAAFGGNTIGMVAIGYCLAWRPNMDGDWGWKAASIDPMRSTRPSEPSVEASWSIVSYPGSC
ncbi:hypothetical protein RRF57_006029 [Xylaria bambusicola]|uniref:Uncharacterized protein n=1 Tax=Xylaria bambusicola TaxID=326684 RepID=A0AAN7URV0_9PEZI